tara:strand:- start:832 stop:1419 length:588 start_codon:yes stop_codon:yes gene_type:complete
MYKIKEKKAFVESGYTNIFSMKEFEDYINTNIFVLEKNLFIKFQKHKYYWDDKHWDVFGKSIPSAALEVMLKEETCVIVNAKKATKKIYNIVKKLEEINNLETDCHMFYCSSDIKEKGLGKHNDSNDNFIIQIYGTTDLTIWSDPMINTTLNPGDACYIPRKTDHCLISKSKRLSLSFPMAYNKNVINKDYWIRL